MKMVKISEVVPDPDRLVFNVGGPFDSKVSQMVRSLRETGQMWHPLRVKQREDGRYDLLTGYVRFRAARVLGWTGVPVIVTALDDLRTRAAVIDENLVRRKEHWSVEARMLFERKEIHEALHPETKVGGAGRGREKVRHGGEPIERYTMQAAEETGKGERTVQRLTMLGESATPKLLQAGYDGWVTLTEAEKIASLPAGEQDAALERLKQPKPPPPPPSVDQLVQEFHVHAQQVEDLLRKRGRELRNVEPALTALEEDREVLRRCVTMLLNEQQRRRDDAKFDASSATQH